MKASGNDNEAVLVAGDINGVFVDEEAVNESPLLVREMIRDAIDTAAKQNFKAIAVVITGLSNRLSSLLKVLRAVNSEAKIILLAQMHEEPAALEMVKSNSYPRALADDYLICPLKVSELFKTIEVSHKQIPTQHESLIEFEPDIQMKIRYLEKLATTDELTGLKNRRYLWEFAKQVIAGAKKQNAQVTLLVFDIDNFKNYNDLYGHLAGDEILKQAALLIRRCCRGHDVVGRIGGDEFAVVFWEDPKRKTASGKTERRSVKAHHPREPIFIAERFRNELKNAELHLLGPKGKGVLTISGGLASFPQDGMTIEELFRQADNALLNAKKRGKNRIYLVGKPNNDIAKIK